MKQKEIYWSLLGILSMALTMILLFYTDPDIKPYPKPAFNFLLSTGISLLTLAIVVVLAKLKSLYNNPNEKVIRKSDTKDCASIPLRRGERLAP